MLEGRLEAKFFHIIIGSIPKKKKKECEGNKQIIIAPVVVF